MYLNKEGKEMLVDYILEHDKSRYMDDKFPGFEAIVIALCNEGKVHFPLSKDSVIEDYLCSFNFIEHLGGNELVTLKVDLQRLINDIGYKKYVNEMILDTKREIRQLTKDAKELGDKVSKMSALVEVI